MRGKGKKKLILKFSLIEQREMEEKIKKKQNDKFVVSILHTSKFENFLFFSFFLTKFQNFLSFLSIIIIIILLKQAQDKGLGVKCFLLSALWTGIAQIQACLVLCSSQRVLWKKRAFLLFPMTKSTFSQGHEVAQCLHETLLILVLRCTRQ